MGTDRQVKTLSRFVTLRNEEGWRLREEGCAEASNEEDGCSKRLFINVTFLSRFSPPQTLAPSLNLHWDSRHCGGWLCPSRDTALLEVDGNA